MHVTRRDFVKNGALTAGALAAGTALIACTGLNAALVILAGGLVGLTYYRSRLQPPQPPSESKKEAE